MTILVVDESRTTRTIVVRTLRPLVDRGTTFVEARSGAEALLRLEAGGSDLVIAGWDLVDMSGAALLAAFRRTGWDGPFGFAAWRVPAPAPARAVALGAVCLVTRPFLPEAFSRAVQALHAADRATG